MLLKNKRRLPSAEEGRRRSIAVVGPTRRTGAVAAGQLQRTAAAAGLPARRALNSSFMVRRQVDLRAGLDAWSRAWPCRSSTLRCKPAKWPAAKGSPASTSTTPICSGKPVVVAHRSHRQLQLGQSRAGRWTCKRNNYSVRWTGTFTPPAAGDYKLGVRMNYCYACENAEGFRLYLDDKLLVASEQKATGERGAGMEASVHFDDTQPHRDPPGIRARHGQRWHRPDLAGAGCGSCATRRSKQRSRRTWSSRSSASRPTWKAKRCR